MWAEAYYQCLEKAVIIIPHSITTLSLFPLPYAILAFHGSRPLWKPARSHERARALVQQSLARVPGQGPQRPAIRAQRLPLSAFLPGMSAWAGQR